MLIEWFTHTTTDMQYVVIIIGAIVICSIVKSIASAFRR